ncbi:MAG: hypothetical protein CMN77_11080 [Spirochaetaceae bacterium]|nr:hypothetical protein [Spirochaetaceae bacterium]
MEADLFFAIVAGFGGLYLILMVAGLLHRDYMKSWNRPRKMALAIMGTGFLILGMYFGYLAYFLSTPEGQEHQRQQREMNRMYFPEQQR